MDIICKIEGHLLKYHDPSKAFPGYTLFATMGTKNVWLVDIKGRFVHRWQLPHPLRTQAKLLPNGNLIVNQTTPNCPMEDMPASADQLIEVDWDSNIVWKYEDPHLNGHDWDRLSNGNTLVSHWAPVPSDIASKVKGGRPGSEREGIMWGDCFREITPDGKVVWEWIAYEHMDFDNDILCPLCPRETLTYANSLVGLPNEDVLTSFRLINTIAIIDKYSGNIKWKWGQGELGHQHNPTLLDNGNILLYDNGLHRNERQFSVPYSRVLEVNPKTNEIQWEYNDPNLMASFSPICGGTQRLPNGNTLVCESTKGRIFEITREGEIVWEFINPFYTYYRKGVFGLINMVFRALRYSPDYPGLKGRNLDPDRFEWVLQEKAIKHPSQKEQLLKERLKRLGY
jgi:hypothetical protein